MPETIRTFIAIELNDALRRALAQLQAQFSQERGANSVRWVAPESIHITLKFIGDVEAPKMPSLQRVIADACAGVPPFTLTLAHTGAFPNVHRPNVVWVGTQGQVDAAVRLSQRIDDACAALGYAREPRAFSPHLTLGRVKRDVAPGDRQRVGEMIAKVQVNGLGDLRVESIAIMKSQLQAGGSVYARLHRVELKPPQDTDDEETHHHL